MCIEGETSMQFFWIRTVQGLGLRALLLLCLAIAACSDAVCPAGTTQHGDRCQQDDAVTAVDSGTDESGEEKPSGSSGTSANASASSAAGMSVAGSAVVGGGGSGTQATRVRARLRTSPVSRALRRRVVPAAA